MKPTLPAVLLALALTSPALAARTAAAPDAQTLAATSRAVVHVRVEAAETVRQRHAVHTTYQLTPLHTLSGTPPTALTVVLPGGQLGDVTVRAHGVPVWSVGDEAVVFIAQDGSVGLDRVVTVDRGLIVDPSDRSASAMPATVEALQRSVLAVTPPSARP